jgi:hypothetical protein
MCHAILAMYSLLIGGAIGGSKQIPPYDQLCLVYEEFSTQPLTSERAVELAERIQRELPDVYADYGMFADADYRQRYDLIRTLAREKSTGNTWRCDAVRKVYTPLRR